MLFPNPTLPGGIQNAQQILDFGAASFALYGTGSTVSPYSPNEPLQFPNTGIAADFLSKFVQPDTVSGLTFSQRTYPSVAPVTRVTAIGTALPATSVQVTTNLTFNYYQIAAGSNNFPAVISNRRNGNNPPVFFITASTMVNGFMTLTLARPSGGNITTTDLAVNDEFNVLTQGTFGEISGFGSPLTMYPTTTERKMVQISRTFAVSELGLSSLSVTGLGEGNLEQTWKNFRDQMNIQAAQFQIDEDMVTMFGEETPNVSTVAPQFSGLWRIANAANAAFTYVGPTFDETYLQAICRRYANFGITEVLAWVGTAFLSNVDNVGRQYQLGASGYGPVGDTLRKFGQSFTSYTHAGVTIHFTNVPLFNNQNRAPMTTNFATGFDMGSAAYFYTPYSLPGNGSPVIEPVYSKEFMAAQYRFAGANAELSPVPRPTRRFMSRQPSRYDNPDVSNGSSVGQIMLESRFGFRVWHPHLTNTALRIG